MNMLYYQLASFCFLFSFFFKAVIGVITYTESECLNVNSYFWKHLSAKTPYRFIAFYDNSEITYSDCQPKKIWAVVRHGTRYPGVKFISKITTRLLEIRESIVKENKVTLCNSTVSNIKKWIPQMDLSDGKKLAHEGEDEMIELAERYQSRFPTLLPLEYSNSSFHFQCTATERTQQSKYYFLIGLFGRRVANQVWSPEPIYRDPLLRFYKLCRKWLKEVHKNPKAISEVERFQALNSTADILRSISHRLGFGSNLSFSDLEIIYTTCAFESALNRASVSPWCYVFTEKEMEVMEYVKDLKYYWLDGYGYKINFQQACPLMVNMLNNLRSDIGPKSTFYFTHSGTILKLLSHLGLYYDEDKLTHDNFDRPRLWKASHIDAFASNVAFVSFQCKDQLKVLTLHQERPVILPGCPKEGLCPLDKLMKTFKESFNNCYFEEMCET